MSLKHALEILLGAPCYHMAEVSHRPDHVELWRLAGGGEMPDWDELFDGYAAAVDWPVASFWEELAAAYPDSIILHSTRRDSETWFRSATDTILRPRDREPDDPRERMWRSVSGRVFDGPYSDRAVAIAGYERHNRYVVDTAPPERLVSYQPGDGWEPLCRALDVPVPDEPFPHTNTTAEFRRRAGLDT
jgi:hypothetical protein